MLNLATDPRAEGQRLAVADLVECMQELLSDDCPDVLETKYALRHHRVPTENMNSEQIESLRQTQRHTFEMLRQVAFDIRDNGYSSEDANRLKTIWRLKDSTIWLTSGTRRLAIGLALGLKDIPALEPEPPWLRCPVCECEMEIYEGKPGRLEAKRL